MIGSGIAQRRNARPSAAGVRSADAILCS